MSDLFAATIPLSDQLACVEREIAMRRKVYPRWVADKKIPAGKAEREVALMEAVAKTLRELEERDGR